MSIYFEWILVLNSFLVEKFIDTKYTANIVINIPEIDVILF